MIAVDTSALMAILLNEPDADACIAVLEAENDLVISAGSSFALVGESGSGKSTLALCMARLEQPGEGRIWFEGQDLFRLSGPELMRVRRHIQLIFQGTAAALNPRFSAEEIIIEPLRIQSVGTSSFSGVPSDTFGVAAFWLMLLPVVVRLDALASAARPPVAAVLFGPAIAWLAPAGYVLMRLLALMGGRLPDRPTAVLLFLGGALAALVFATAALWMPRSARQPSWLLAAQAALALALSSAGEPLATVAAAWLWLLLIPLAGLVSVRVEPRSPAAALTRLQLAMVPATLAFTGLVLGALTLNARGLAVAIIPLGLVVFLAAMAGRRCWSWSRPFPGRRSACSCSPWRARPDRCQPAPSRRRRSGCRRPWAPGRPSRYRCW